jgi:isopenicillin N synthase-like dioxygenase
MINSNSVNMGQHTDYECFTFIYQTFPGIQGYIRQSDNFIDLPVFKDTLLMMVGDVMDFMTNSYLKSFLHRVVNTPFILKIFMSNKHSQTIIPVDDVTGSKYDLFISI